MSETKKIELSNLGQLIRKCRQQRKLTLKELCDKAGMSVGYLSQVERGNATPSLGTLAQISHALDLGPDYFIARPKPGDAVSYARQRATFSVSNSGVTYETLSAEFPGQEITSFLMTCPVGFQSETFQHEGEEIIYILSGSIEQNLDGETFVLEAGDSLHFNGMTPHSWKTLGDSPARMIWTGTLVVLQGSSKGRLPGQGG